MQLFWFIYLFLISSTKISCTDHVRNEEVLFRVKEQRNIRNEIGKRKANWIGHILRRNCLLQRVIEGKINGMIEVIGRRGRRRRKLLDDLKERRGYSHLKEEALDLTMRRARFGRCFGPVIRQTTQWMKQLYMFRAMSSPIIRSTWLYLQHLILSTGIVAGRCHGWDGTAFHQQYRWTISVAVNTVKCSWWRAKTSPETCGAD